MSKRTRIIGAQAVVVALLVLVIYVSLLLPEGSGPLRGISGPGDGQEQVGKPPDRKEADGEGAGLDAAGGAPGAGPGAPGGAGGRQGRDALAVDTSPTDDQYRDAASVLIRKLGGDR